MLVILVLFFFVHLLTGTAASKLPQSNWIGDAYAMVSWSDCVGICTDGAPSMTGSIKGFVTLAKIKNPLIFKTHCFIHREALMTKTLGSELDSILLMLFILSTTLKESF